jgi:prephenate dehydrogenase
VKVAFLGFGLIGGSVARALRREGSPTLAAARTWRLSAWSPSGGGPRAALADDVIDEASADPRTAIDGASLVVLAGPVPACLAMLDDLATELRDALDPDVVITDVASTKVALALRATVLGLRYVGGHPMAGLENAGYGASTATLFVDRPWVVVPDGDPSAMERVEGLARATGARPVRMSATAHDQAVAGISHLPLVLAAALVEAVAGRSDGLRSDWPDARTLAAGGWRDMTRLARGDAAMGAGIVTTNHAALAARTRDLIAVLGTWVDELERSGGPDPTTIQGRLADARTILDRPIGDER